VGGQAEPPTRAEGAPPGGDVGAPPRARSPGRYASHLHAPYTLLVSRSPSRRKLLVSWSCTYVRVNLPLQPRTRLRPPCRIPRVRTGEEEIQGGLIRTRGQKANAHQLPMALRGAFTMPQLVRAYSVTFVEYPERFTIASSCGGVGKCNAPSCGRGSAFIGRLRLDAGSPSLLRWLEGIISFHALRDAL